MKKITNNRIPLRRASVVGLLLFLLMICLTASPLIQNQSAAAKILPLAQPTPPNDPLDEDQLAALVENLKGALTEAVEDEDMQTAITDKWDARMDSLVGKTAKQVTDLLMADVKSVVKDADTLKTLRENFTAAAAGESNDTADNTPADKPDPAPANPVQPVGRPGSNAALRQYIRNLNYDPRTLLSVPAEGGTLLYEKVKKEEKDRTPGDGKITRCTRRVTSLSKGFDEVAILQPTQGVVYPGAMVFADEHLVDGKPRPLTGLPRAPIDLRLDLPGLEDEGSFTITNPTDGRVQTSLNKALNFWNNSTSFKNGYVNASRSSYNWTVAYSSEQLAMSLGFNAKWASGDAAAQFKFASSGEKNVVVAVYKQVFYTVTFDAPNTPEAFFDASVTPEEAKEVFASAAETQTKDKLVPAYVSSVNYGRIIMLRMETDKNTTKADAEAALNYSTGAVTVGGSASFNYNKILSNSTITVITMGGNAEVASETVTAHSPADLAPIIKGKNARYSKDNPGVPIAYTVKFLKDNSIAKMGTTTDYATTECQDLNNLWVKVVHSGAYIAHFNVSWDEPDRPNQSRREEGKTAGFQQKFDFPGDATNIRLKMENDTGLVWQPRREIFNRLMQPDDLNCVYTVTGTTLGSSSSKGDCELRKP